MGIRIQQIKNRENKLHSFHSQTRKNPNEKRKPRMVEKEKQHEFIQSKLKNNCVKCGRSFKKVKRKVTYGRKRGIKRKNYCISCSKYLVKQTNNLRRQRWDNFKLLWVLNHGGKCSQCSYADLSCISVFDFHHKQDEIKEFSLSVLTNFGYSLTNKKLFIKEARKCLIVCANCHRKIGKGGVPSV